MNPAAPGPELRDIHLPAPPGWWPPAPGWWILALVALAAIAWLSRLAYRRWRRRRQRIAILAELDRDIAAAGEDPARLAAALSQFLRRLSKQLHPDAVALSGAAWLEHLDRSVAGGEFSTGVGRALVDAPFQRTPQFDAAALRALVRRWTRNALLEDRARA
jgi:uncharacterized protein DUF4381